jgi:hypothetical protein
MNCDVAAAVDIGAQRRDVGPDRHVDRHQRVFERLQIGGVVAFALQAPDEAGRGLGQGVDRVEVVEEVLDHRMIDRRAQAADIDLGQFELRAHGIPSVFIEHGAAKLAGKVGAKKKRRSGRALAWILGTCACACPRSSL